MKYTAKKKSQKWKNLNNEDDEGSVLMMMMMMMVVLSIDWYSNSVVVNEEYEYKNIHRIEIKSIKRPDDYYKCCR